MELNDLSKSGLVSLAKEYSNYIKNDVCCKNIITINPMSIDEYLNSEFFSYDKISDRVKSKVISFEDEYADIFTETSADIMNVFEDVLGEHNMKIPDKCREGNEDEAMIYGETYYEMESLVEDLICECTEKIYNTFNRIPIKEVDLDDK